MDIGIVILVVALIFTIYGGLHYYVYRKLIRLFPLRKRLIPVVLIVLAVLVFVVELLTHNDLISFAYPLAGVAYGWMGLVFMFFFISGSLDLLEFILRKLSLEGLSKQLASKKRTFGVGIVVVLLGLSGYLSAQQIHVETIRLKSEKLTRPLRIVQISDLHLGILGNKNRIALLVEAVNKLNADIIVSTGDLVDMQANHIQGMAEQLSRMNARFGKYAVYGNHEVFAGLNQAREVIDMAGFQLLSNTGITLDSLVTIIGVDDPAVSGNIQNSNLREAEILQPFSSDGLFTVLLKHQPVIDEESTKYFDLQLSGHTHGGQIFPFGLLTKLIYPIGFGLVTLSKDTWVYVSRGTGTWGPPMRILARPEVTLFELYSV